jgi:hypothetical protein
VAPIDANDDMHAYVDNLPARRQSYFFISLINVEYFGYFSSP